MSRLALAWAWMTLASYGLIHAVIVIVLVLGVAPWVQGTTTLTALWVSLWAAQVLVEGDDAL
jgi:hypothetical protein